MLHCHSDSLSQYYTVNLPAYHNVTLSVCQPVTLLHCQPDNLSHCYTVNLTACHTVTLSTCQPVTMLHCQSASLSHCYTVNLPACFTVRLSDCQPVTLSACHTVSLSACRRKIFSRLKFSSFNHLKLLALGHEWIKISNVNNLLEVKLVKPYKANFSLNNLQ